MTRYICYTKNIYGMWVLRYSDTDGNRKTMRYNGYTLKEAIQKFRKDYNLKNKKIIIMEL